MVQILVKMYVLLKNFRNVQIGDTIYSLGLMNNYSESIFPKNHMYFALFNKTLLFVLYVIIYNFIFLQNKCFFTSYNISGFLCRKKQKEKKNWPF